jgi:O-antigen ligase
LGTVAVFVVESIRQRTHLQWRTPYTIPAVVFLVAGAISVLDAPSRTAALGLYRAYLIEPIALAFVIAHVVRSHRQAYVVLAGLGIAGAVVGAANSVVVLSALRSHTYNVTETPPVVIYSTANAVALFLVPLCAVAGSLMVYGPGRRERVLGAAFLVIGIPSVLLSFSRGGYLAMAACALGLAISHRRRVWLVAATVASGLLLLLIPPIGTRILIQLQNGYGNTFIGRAGRLSLWSDTLQMLKERPIFGAGLSGFAERIAPFWNANHPERFIDPHNIVLNFWVETGLLGVFAFAWLLVIAFRMSWRGWHSRYTGYIPVGDLGWQPIQLGVLLALVAVVVHGLVDVPYFKNDLSLLFWTVVALSMAGQLSVGRAPDHT